MMRKGKRKPFLFGLIGLLAFSFIVPTVAASWVANIVGPAPAESNSTATSTTPVAYFGNRYFKTIESAVKAANDVDSSSNKITVYVIPNLKDSSGNALELQILDDLTVDEYVTLCLPYNGTTWCNTTSVDNWTSNATEEYADSSATNVKTYRKTFVSIASKKTLKVNGTLYVGGVFGNSGQGISSNTNGSYAEIGLYSGAKILINGTYEGYGYIKELTSNNNGSVFEASNGSSIKHQLVFHDYKGGSLCYGLYSIVSPLKIFDVPNIQCLYKINFGANVIGRVRIHPSTDVDETVTFVSSSNAILILKSGYMTIKYTPVNFGYTNRLWDGKKFVFTNYKPTIAKAYGDIELGFINITMQIKMSFLTVPVTIDTRNYFLPMSYRFNIDIISGTITVNNDAAFLPGSKLTIGSGATMNVEKNLIFYRNTYVDNGGTDGEWWYPKGRGDAYLENNGTVTVTSTGSIGGLMKSASANSVLDFKSAKNLQVTANDAYGSGSGLNVKTTRIDQTENAKGIVYNTSSESILEKNRYVSDGDDDINHWDSVSLGYPIVFKHYYDNQIIDHSFVEENFTSSNPANIPSSGKITLSYFIDSSDTYICTNFYLSKTETGFAELISAGVETDLSNCLERIIADDHILNVYVEWISASAPKVKYQIGNFDGITTTTDVPNYSDPVDALLDGGTITLPSSLTRPAVHNNNKVYVYEFERWDIYRNDDSTPVGTISIGTTSYTVSDVIFDEGDVIKFCPVFSSQNYPYPSVKSLTNPKSTTSLATDQTSKVTAVVQNANKDIFEIVPVWSSSNEGKVTVASNGDDGTNTGDNEYTYYATVRNKDSNDEVDSSNNTVTISFYVKFRVKGTSDSYRSSDPSTTTQLWTSYKASSCFTPETLITMADGTQKMIKEIERGDLVQTFNHETGTVEIRPVFLIEKVQNDIEKDCISLAFDNGNTLDIIGYHNVFIQEYLNYANIDSCNYTEFIGLTAVFENNGVLEKTKIINATCEKYYGDAYTICASEIFNVFTNDILTVTPNELWMPLFEIHEDYKFDSEEIQNDIDTYGLYSYGELSLIVKQYLGEDAFPEEVLQYMFYATNAKYFKIGIGKGFYTFESLMNYLINDQSNYLDS